MSSILRGSEDCLIWKGENHGIFEGYHNLGDHLLCYSVDSLEFKKQCHIQKFRIEVIQREPWEHIKYEDIKKTVASFCEEIWQVPPMFSAVKVSFPPLFCYKLAETGRGSLQKNGISVPNEFCHTMKGSGLLYLLLVIKVLNLLDEYGTEVLVGGEKMYEKARRGESIGFSPRWISIFHFDIEQSLDDRQNLIFRVTCSKGTYVRSLCADLGKALNSCAHLIALRRDSIVFNFVLSLALLRASISSFKQVSFEAVFGIKFSATSQGLISVSCNKLSVL